MNVESELVHSPVRNHVPLSALEMFLALMMLNLTLQPLVEPDFGWHLRAGLDFLNNGWRLPDHDPYSHTMPDWPWVEHAWLTNAILALIYRGLGMVGGLGIIAFFAFLTIGAFLVASARAQAGRSYRLAAITASLWVALPFLGARTQLVSLAGIAIILWLYHRIVRDRPAFLWLYPPVFLLWANLHGGFTAGLFFTGLILAVSLIVRAVLARWPAARVDEPILSWDRIGWLALSLTLSSLLTLVNPYGWRLHVEIYESLTDRFMIETLREWQPFSLSGWAATAYVTYLMTMVGLVLRMVSAGRTNPFDAPACFTGLVFFALAQRDDLSRDRRASARRNVSGIRRVARGFVRSRSYRQAISKGHRYAGTGRHAVLIGP